MEKIGGGHFDQTFPEKAEKTSIRKASSLEEYTNYIQTSSIKDPPKPAKKRFTISLLNKQPEAELPDGDNWPFSSTTETTPAEHSKEEIPIKEEKREIPNVTLEIEPEKSVENELARTKTVAKSLYRRGRRVVSADYTREIKKASGSRGKWHEETILDNLTVRVPSKGFPVQDKQIDLEIQTQALSFPGFSFENCILEPLLVVKPPKDEESDSSSFLDTNGILRLRQLNEKTLRMIGKKRNDESLTLFREGWLFFWNHDIRSEPLFFQSHRKTRGFPPTPLIPLAEVRQIIIDQVSIKHGKEMEQQKEGELVISNPRIQTFKKNAETLDFLKEEISTCLQNPESRRTESSETVRFTAPSLQDLVKKNQ